MKSERRHFSQDRVKELDVVLPIWYKGTSIRRMSREYRFDCTEWNAW
jgi:hypothetical protein